VVATATMRAVMNSIVICNVLCCKMTMYCCEDYGLSLIMSKLELSFYILLLYVPVYHVIPVLEAPHPGR
jgi:hypothetical protein